MCVFRSCLFCSSDVLGDGASSLEGQWSLMAGPGRVRMLGRPSLGLERPSSWARVWLQLGRGQLSRG